MKSVIELLRRNCSAEPSSSTDSFERTWILQNWEEDEQFEEASFRTLGLRLKDRSLDREEEVEGESLVELEGNEEHGEYSRERELQTIVLF